MRPDIAEEALPFSEKETQGNGWRFPKRKTSEQSEHCSDVAEKEGFEPSRQSPQPTPLAGEPLTATWVLLHGYIAGAMLNYMAEREGFEPPVPCGITGFQDQLHKPLGHLSIFKLYNYSKGFSHCQAGRFSKKWLKPFLRVFSDFASRVRSRAAKPAKYENLWFSSVLPHMSSKPE